MSRSELENYSWFSKNYQLYKPDTKLIKKIKSKKTFSVFIILGTWCSDSKEQVPAFLKVCDELGVKEIQLIGVNRKKESAKFNLEFYQINLVPLFIIYRNNKEIGRIVETPKISLEKDLLKIVR